MGDGWPLAKLVACYGSSLPSLGSNPDISQKYKIGDTSKRNGQHTLARQKMYKKIIKIN